MKPLSVFVALVLIFFSALGVSAGDVTKINGEVLYHQDFSRESDLDDSGIRIGTQSSVNSKITCDGETLEIKTFDKGRVYAILPEIVKESTYTAEFSFRFTEINAENGFISMILTCRGDEPTNISGVTIRADGTVDDFDVPCEMVRNAVRSGELVNVQIPIRNNVVNEIVMTAGEYQCVVERDNILVISDGQMGFSVRNASVELPEIFVVHGVDYNEKSGCFADSSYASDDEDEVVQPKPSETTDCDQPEAGVECSPDTGDALSCTATAFVVGMTAVWGNSRRCRRG